ncbi:MAG: metallophosphoesterase [Myxococcota bacterium]|nr:metallophosphoesterase [Myxococcota bacterium]
MRSSVRSILAAISAAALAAILVWNARDVEVAPPADPSLSLLAVGDAGQPPEKDPDRIQLRVGEAMAAEDRREAADAVLLLGDNFYPKGLRTEEMLPRLRENLVRPYCHFLTLDGPRSDEVADACPTPLEERHPLPLHAVLGNHDYQSDESPGLQRQVVPELVPRFRVPPTFTDEIRFEPDVSVVLIDSQKLFHKPEERIRFLTEALRASRGPLRIVASHHPPRVLDPDGEDAEWTKRAEPWIERAIEEAGVPVHLWLAGHEHSLQIVEGYEGGPELLVISGAGSDPRSVRSHEGVRFAESVPGFVRVDRVDGDSGSELVVTLFAAETAGPRALAQARVVP